MIPQYRGIDRIYRRTDKHGAPSRTFIHNHYQCVRMGTHHVTSRVPDDLFEAIEEVQEDERIDRSTAVAQLLERGVKEWRIDTAVQRYRDKEISVGRAADIANLSLWRFLDVLDDRGIEVNYDREDLAADIAAVSTE